MSKRFADTDIWRQSWFVDLSPESKLVWFYLVSKCDTVGIWKIDFRQLLRETGARDINLQTFLEEVNRDYVSLTGEPVKRNRVMRIANGKNLWLTGFISFQYEKGRNGINAAIPAINGALNRLRDENLYEFAIKEGFVRIKGECESEKKIEIDGYNINFSEIISSVNIVSSDLIDNSDSNSINNNILAAADSGNSKGWQPFARDKDKDKDQDLQLFVLKDFKRGECEGGEVHREKPGEAGLFWERVRGQPINILKILDINRIVINNCPGTLSQLYSKGRI